MYMKEQQYETNKQGTFFWLQLSYSLEKKVSPLLISSESAHWADSVSKLRCPSVCLLSVALFLYGLLLPFTKVESQIDDCKKIPLGKI